MAPKMSSRIAVREMGFISILLFVSLTQALHFEAHRHDHIRANRNDIVILTTRDFLEQLNFVVPKTSYTLQESTEYLLQFGALQRARILDTFGSLLYIYYDDFSIEEVDGLRKVYNEMLERRFDVFELVPDILKKSDTRPSKICTEVYDHSKESCLRSSASVCRRIRKHNLPHLEDQSTTAVNITYQIYRSSKISKHYPRGFSLDALLKLLQREVLTITPNLLAGLICNIRYEKYDVDVRHAEKELVRHFNKTVKIREVSTTELKKFHTMNAFLKYYVNVYAEESLSGELQMRAFLLAKRIAYDVGTIDENIYLLGNVYESQTIQLDYLFDLVLPDDLLEIDVIEAKRYLIRKLNKHNVVEKYLRVQKYQHATPAQLTIEIMEQLRDIDFAKDIATSLRMHAKFWHTSRMIESLDEMLELFDAYEHLRHESHHKHMMRSVDRIKKSLHDMKNIPVEILCNSPRTCLQIGLRLILECNLISYSIKTSIQEFLELSDVCIYIRTIQESRRQEEIPFTISRVRYSTTMQTESPHVETTHIVSETKESAEMSKKKSFMEEALVDILEESLEIASTETTTKPIYKDDISVTSTTPTTVLPTTTPTTTTTTIPTTTTTTIAPTTTTTMPTTTTTLPTTTTTLPTTTTTLPTTTTTLPTTTTTLPTTTTTLPTTTTTLPTTTTTLPTTTTTLPTTTTTLSTTTTTLPTTTTTITTTTTTLPTTITISPTTTTTLPTTLPVTSTTTVPTTTTELMTTTTTSPTTTETTTVAPVTTEPVEMKWQRSTVRIVKVPHHREVYKKTKNLTAIDTSVEISQESSEATITQSPQMKETSSLKMTKMTSSKLSKQDSASEVSLVMSRSDEESIEITKGDKICAKTCLERCRSKSESLETSGRYCCDSVIEDCEVEDSISKVSLECRTDKDKDCECPIRERKRAECMTLCSSSSAESSSCEDDCVMSAMPKIGVKFEHVARMRGMCEIRNVHHRRQQKRLAKMREISVNEVRRPTMSRHRGRITTKKLYNLLATQLPDSKNRKIAEYLLKRPGNDEDRKRRKRIYRPERKRRTRKRGEKSKNSRRIKSHFRRVIEPSRYSQTRRISGRESMSP